MTERFSSESRPESDITDEDVERAIDSYLYEINYGFGQELASNDVMAILAKLVESGVELDPDYREALREKIRQLLGGRPGIRLSYQ